MNCIDTFILEKNHSQSTATLYKASVKAYEKVNNGISLDELIEEADREEEQKIRWKHRTLKKRLVHFRKWLFDNQSEGTANRYLSCIRTIYRHFEIELQDLPSFNSNQIQKTYEKKFEDIPTREELKSAYYEASNVCKDIIVFGISTGLSKVDMLKMTVDDYFGGFDNLTSDTVIGKLYEIKAMENPIPCFEGTRQKTGTSYIAFASPEAVEHLTHTLIGRDAQIREKFEKADDDEDLPDQLYGSDKLFDISNSHLLYSFKKINNKLKLGKVGHFSKFRCHQLRAYQASVLVNLEENPFTMEEVDALQGRKKDKTHRAYFMESKSKLRKKYTAAVDELMLFKSIHGIDKEEFKKVKAENNFFKKEIVKNERKMEEQQKTIDKIITAQKELESLVGL